MHLSLHALLAAQTRWHVANTAVFVCENANIVAVAAARLGPRCAPLICTDGMPSACQRALLQQLSHQGARLHYHGDFDWAGLHIGNYVIRTFAAVPWRFTASEYRPVDGRRLIGRPVAATWDGDLAPRMEAAGLVMDEELMIADLLVDLGTSAVV